MASEVRYRFGLPRSGPGLRPRMRFHRQPKRRRRWRSAGALHAVLVAARPRCADFEPQMAGCNSCQGVVDNLRKTITLCKHGRPFELPLEFQQRLHAAPRDRWKTTHRDERAAA